MLKKKIAFLAFCSIINVSLAKSMSCYEFSQKHAGGDKNVTLQCLDMQNWTASMLRAKSEENRKVREEVALKFFHEIRTIILNGSDPAKIQELIRELKADPNLKLTKGQIEKIRALMELLLIAQESGLDTQDVQEFSTILSETALGNIVLVCILSALALNNSNATDAIKELINKIGLPTAVSIDALLILARSIQRKLYSDQQSLHFTEEEIDEIKKILNTKQ